MLLVSEERLSTLAGRPRPVLREGRGRERTAGQAGSQLSLSLVSAEPTGVWQRASWSWPLGLWFLGSVMSGCLNRPGS